MKFKVQIKGVAPLLQNKFDEDSFWEKTKVSRKKPTESEKREIADNLLHKDEKGNPAIPASYIEGCMTKASTQFRLAGAGKKTYKELVSGGVFAFPEYATINSKNWVVDSRMVKNRSTGGAQIKYRPRFDNYTVDFVLEVHDNRAEPDMIKQILEHGGMYIGIGSYHPKFGRFEVTKFTPEK